MRYGKTDWNVQHKLQGRIDIPNNEKYMKNVIDKDTQITATYFTGTKAELADFGSLRIISR